MVRESIPRIFLEFFMPWLCYLLPYREQDFEEKESVTIYFKIEGIPSLIVLGPDGKTLQTEAVELVMEHGVQVYPFTKEKLDEIKSQKEARRATQTLESLLVSDERNFVNTHTGKKVQVSELTGKTVGLYFSAHWCPLCREFTPKLAEVYNELKQKGEAFEIVFLSSDRDQEAFEEYYASMPWLALPFRDKIKKDLSCYFHVKGIPSLVIIGPDGKTVAANARDIVSVHGAKAYPFTDSRLAELQKEIEELAEKWPKEVKHGLHEHSQSLSQRQAFNCDGCDEGRSGWSFYCKECDFELHPDCAVRDDDSEKNGNICG
ncbi:hypothetical protein KI387_043278 [Taxus chinensis]|uniref:protein-disulfide reductase n=1 Tax=Taxus chinensis TaxID=29808 RepID=A0AA38F6P1_TAXCH|nr:hypothetical protein KI387_043278 [Taxus chinensis]